MDTFHQGLMLGEVLAISKHTAAKVDVIEARQSAIIQRIDKLEAIPPRRSSPTISKVVLAAGAAISGGLANLKAEEIVRLVSALLGSH
jgi:hypothetical protein